MNAQIAVVMDRRGIDRSECGHLFKVCRSQQQSFKGLLLLHYRRIFPETKVLVID